MDIFFYDKIFNFFFPAKCGFCGEITGTNSYICSECKRILCNEDRNCCNLCGKKIYLEENICRECRERRVYYEKLIFFDEYKDVLKDRIIAYKFNDKSYLYSFFAELLMNKIIDEEIDLITAIPISKRRMKERGYNQSELIAKRISKLTGIPYFKLLVKTRETKRQSELSKIERMINVKDSFVFNNKFNIKDKKILLVDDVFTTGATINECSKILKKLGSMSIKALVIARGVN